MGTGKSPFTIDKACQRKCAILGSGLEFSAHHPQHRYVCHCRYRPDPLLVARRPRERGAVGQQALARLPRGAATLPAPAELVELHPGYLKRRHVTQRGAPHLHASHLQRDVVVGTVEHVEVEQIVHHQVLHLETLMAHVAPLGLPLAQLAPGLRLILGARAGALPAAPGLAGELVHEPPEPRRLPVSPRGAIDGAPGLASASSHLSVSSRVGRARYASTACTSTTRSDTSSATARPLPGNPGFLCRREWWREPNARPRAHALAASAPTGPRAEHAHRLLPPLTCQQAADRTLRSTAAKAPQLAQDRDRPVSGVVRSQLVVVEELRHPKARAAGISGPVRHPAQRDEGDAVRGCHAGHGGRLHVLGHRRLEGLYARDGMTRPTSARGWAVRWRRDVAAEDVAEALGRVGIARRGLPP